MAIYHIDSYGSDTELLVRGIAKTISLAKASKLSQAAVAAHDKRQVSGSNIWEEAIGEAATKSLGAGKVIMVVEKSGEFEREVVAMQKESQTNLVHHL